MKQMLDEQKAQRSELKGLDYQTQDVKHQLEEAKLELKNKQTKQKIAKHKLDEVRRNIRVADKELKAYTDDPEAVYKIKLRDLRLPNDIVAFEKMYAQRKKNKAKEHKNLENDINFTVD